MKNVFKIQGFAVLPEGENQIVFQEINQYGVMTSQRYFEDFLNDIKWKIPISNRGGIYSKPFEIIIREIPSEQIFHPNYFDFSKKWTIDEKH